MIAAYAQHTKLIKRAKHYNKHYNTTTSLLLIPVNTNLIRMAQFTQLHALALLLGPARKAHTHGSR